MGQCSNPNVQCAVPGRRFGEDLQKQALRQRVEGSPGPEGSPAEVSLIVGAPRWGSRGQGSQVATQTCQVNMGKAWASKIGNDKIILYVFFFIFGPCPYANHGAGIFTYKTG